MNAELEKELNELKAKITPMSTFKFIAGTLAGLGATAAVIAMMKVPLLSAKGVTKLLMRFGIFVLACKVGSDTEDYFKAKVTEIEEEYTGMNKKEDNKNGRDPE